MKKTEKKKVTVYLPIVLEDVLLTDENGKEIKGVTALTTFKKGIVVMTKNAVYSNVPSLLRFRRS